MRVLIVEDEPRLRQTLARMVRALGHEPREAGTSHEAVHALSADGDAAPEAMLLDLQLAATSGLDLLETIRPRHRDLPVIILTGFGDLPAAQHAIRLGVVEFLTKPCPMGDLERALAKAQERALASRPLPHVEEERPEVPAPPPSAPLQDVERSHILAALQRHHGNRRAAAGELGISLRTLYYRLRDYRREG